MSLGSWSRLLKFLTDWSLREWCFASKCFSFHGFKLRFLSSFVVNIRKSISNIFCHTYVSPYTISICKQSWQAFFYGATRKLSTFITGHYRHLLLRSVNRRHSIFCNILLPRQRPETHWKRVRDPSVENHFSSPLKAHLCSLYVWK